MEKWSNQVLSVQSGQIFLNHTHAQKNHHT